MSAIRDLIVANDDNTLSFGDHTLAQKTKLEDFAIGENLYKVKTFAEITRLEKNGALVYESVPGTTVCRFQETEEGVALTAIGRGDCQLTLELEGETSYQVTIAGENAGSMKTNLGGKLSLSVELDPEEPTEIVIYREP